MPAPLRRTATLLAGVVLAAVLTGCGDDDASVSTSPVIAPGRPGEQAETLEPGTAFEATEEPVVGADVEFMAGMIPHHEQAIVMAELAPERAQHETVLGLASRIADIQGAEIAVYQGWLSERGLDDDGGPAGARDGGGHDGDHDDAHGGGDTAVHGMATDEEVDRLRASTGAAFDRLWLELMIRHHEGAVTMVEDRIDDGGVDVRAEELASDVWVTQVDEIATMQAVLAEV